MRDPPWHPMSKSIDLKHIGKLAEELNEAGAACNRCIIQGIDEKEPVTGKLNKEWLEDEIADVLANIQLVTKHFSLTIDQERINLKLKHLSNWHKA